MIDRQAVFDKYAGHCAYCGDKLKQKGGFQVDHIFPLDREYQKVWLFGMEKDFDLDSFENLNPSCPKCNGFKSSFTLEEFRSNLQDQANVAKRNSTAFQRALKWGLVEIIDKPIVFYFEQ